MYSVLWWKNSSKGKRLRRNENLIDEVAYDGKSISFGRLVMEMMIGVVSKIKIMRIEDVIIYYFYLELHQGFWFLRPMDYFYPIKVRKPYVLGMGA